MARNKLLATLILKPLSWLYGMGVGVRNLMFRWKILKSRKFNIPVITVGNIAVGGTGKTPHTEYIIAMLKAKGYKIGVISRGYRRKTKGFVEITTHSTPWDVGDEPYQMFGKYHDANTHFAVDEKRCEAIERLTELYPELNVIVLDDAFQHRYVKPSFSIVLTEFNRPVFFDHLMPFGRLREGRSAMARADVVIVSKCPDKLKPLEYRIFKNHLNLFPYQHLFFSRYNYLNPRPLFPDDTTYQPSLQFMGDDDTILVVTGVANPRPLVHYLRHYKPRILGQVFPDHHDFSRKDLEAIKDKFQRARGVNKIIITTEKDAVRLIHNPYFPSELRRYIYYIPIEVKFEPNNAGTFDDTILKLVANSSPVTFKRAEH